MVTGAMALFCYSFYGKYFGTLFVSVLFFIVVRCVRCRVAVDANDAKDTVVIYIEGKAWSTIAHDKSGIGIF